MIREQLELIPVHGTVTGGFPNSHFRPGDRILAVIVVITEDGTATVNMCLGRGDEIIPQRIGGLTLAIAQALTFFKGESVVEVISDPELLHVRFSNGARLSADLFSKKIPN